jgi:hypothetical protein
MREYYEPGLLARVLRGEPLPKVKDLSALEVRTAEVTVGEPEAERDGAGQPTGQVTVAVDVAAVPGGQGQCSSGSKKANGAFDLRLFRDRQLVGWVDGRVGEAGTTGTGTCTRAENGSARCTFEGIRLPRDGSREAVVFSAYAFNCDEVKSETARVEYALPEGLPRRQGRAYVIAMGVDDSQGGEEGWDLTFAAKDARELARQVGKGLEKSRQSEAVVPVLLLSEKGEASKASPSRATSANLQAVLDRLAGRAADATRLAGILGPGWAERLQPAQPEDVVVLTFSGHGYRDRKGEFYVFPEDIPQGASLRGIEGGDPNPLREAAIASQELEGWLREVDAGELVLVLDACHAAASVEGEGYKPGPFASRGLGQLAYSKGMRVLAASQAAEPAWEDSRYGHGLLTYALAVEGLREGKADADRDGEIRLGEWLRYGVERVPALGREAGQRKVPDAEIIGPELTETTLTQTPALFDMQRSGRQEVVLGR